MDLSASGSILAWACAKETNPASVPGISMGQGRWFSRKESYGRVKDEGIALKCNLVISLILPILIMGCMPPHDAMKKEYPASPGFDLSQIPDGTFLGAYHIDDVDYEVAVTVATHRIKEIKIIRGAQRVFIKKSALCRTNELIQEIIDWQDVTVDAVSGATQTSNAVINAIRDALAPPYAPADDG